MTLLPPVAPADDVVALCRDLIRIDTTNTGDPDTTVGEADAAQYVQARLQEAGWAPERFATSSGTRQGVVLRIPGTDPARPALLLHGHLDVVAADAADWTHDPFGADVVDGMVWGRGAVDMKDMDAMILAVVRQWGFTGRRPGRDVVVLFTPDEEAGGVHGSHWLVDHRPELFEGVTEAVGEVGGFSALIDGHRRLYCIEVAEKGIAWLRLEADGRAGHGSMVNRENAVTRLAEAVARIGAHEWPITPTATSAALLAGLSDLLGEPLGFGDADALMPRLGPLGPMLAPGLRNSVNPTQLQAGYKVNVVPGHAVAHLDGRFLPGHEEALLATVRDLAGPHVQVHFHHRDVALEAPFDVPLTAAMAQALRAADPQAVTVPFLMSGGTDGKAFSRLGIRAYGFAPLRLPAGLDFAALFHGVDERVPVDALEFGVAVLDDFLMRC